MSIISPQARCIVKSAGLSNPQACRGEPVERGRDLVGFEATPAVLGGPGGGGEGA